MASKGGLTPKQMVFVQEFCLTFNATEAAKKAGYSAKTAQEQGSRLLSNVMVQEEIRSFQKKGLEKAKITQEQIINELAHLAFGRLTDVLEWDGDEVRLIPQDRMSERGKAFVDSITIERGIIKAKKPADGDPPEEPKFYIKNLRVTTLSDGKKAALELLGSQFGIKWKDPNGGNGTDPDARKAVLSRLQQLVRKRGISGGEGPSNLG